MNKKRHRSGKREEGYTLVEVLVAIAILAFGLLAVASMQVSGLGGTTKANTTMEATTVAMDRMEKLIAMSFEQAQASGTTNYADNGYSVSAVVNAGPSVNTLSMTITATGRGRTVILNSIKPQIVQN